MTGRKMGFTLVEVLVVISILVILAGLLFPVFAGAREQARRGRCSSNLRNLALSLSMYTQDFDERLLPVLYTDYSWTGTTKDGEQIAAPLQPYLRNREVQRCPSDSSVWQPTGGMFPTSYAWSEKLSDRPLSVVLYPANVVAFNEIWAFHMRRYNRCYDPYPECLGMNTGNEAMLLLVDGHVKYTRSTGTNANPLLHDWRVTFFNERPDDWGQNTYDVR